MNVVDSSAWLEFFAGSQRAGNYDSVILDVPNLLVPVICLYEVFKVVARQRSQSEALQAVAAMQQGSVVHVDGALALSAAQLSLEHGLPMADSLILATARSYGATLWTQDADFEGFPDVRYFHAGDS